MFETVIAEIEGFVERMEGVSSVPADADAIARVRRIIDSLMVRVAAAEITFDAGEGWIERGSGSLRSWLVDECGLSRSEATVSARRVQRLGAWGDVLDAWAAGALSCAQVDVMCSAVPRRFVERFAADAAMVAATVAPLDIAGTERCVRQWVRMAEADDDGDALAERPSGLHVSSTFEGRAVVQGDFDSVSAAMITAALRDFDVADAVDDNGDHLEPRRTASQRRADAFMALVKFGLDHRSGTGDSGRFLPHVALTIDLPELMAASLRGAAVSTPDELEEFARKHDLDAIQRSWFADALHRHGDSVSFDNIDLGAVATSLFACDSVVRRVLSAGSKVIDLGRSVRTTPPPLRRAIIARDRHCRAPGCSREPRFCDVHHVDHWINDGRTDCDRLVLLCSFHHHLFHKPGWTMELDEQATLTVQSPLGRIRFSRPPGHGPPRFSRRVDRAADIPPAEPVVPGSETRAGKPSMAGSSSP